uniref:transcription initiation factor TFIID subunit 4-like n=1 Tax=Callithrix jacchus TaxID=9483 RepID=UPI0023DD5848|nr:transcription initiation factor TFIID subunit 4-like [Callithrix jacchus]
MAPARRRRRRPAPPAAPHPRSGRAAPRRPPNPSPGPAKLLPARCAVRPAALPPLPALAGAGSSGGWGYFWARAAARREPPLNEPEADPRRPAPGGWRTTGLTTRAPAALAPAPVPAPRLRLTAVGSPPAVHLPAAGAQRASHPGPSGRTPAVRADFQGPPGPGADSSFVHGSGTAPASPPRLALASSHSFAKPADATAGLVAPASPPRSPFPPFSNVSLTRVTDVSGFSPLGGSSVLNSATKDTILRARFRGPVPGGEEGEKTELKEKKELAQGDTAFGIARCRISLVLRLHL